MVTSAMSTDKKLIQIQNLNNEIFVYWVLTDFCNQKCHYCPPSLNHGTYANAIKPGHPTDDQLDQFVDKLIDIGKISGKRLRVCVSGGEPTVHAKLPDLIHRLKPHGYITVVTNGTRSVKWWNQLATLPDSVIISLHPEYYDSKKIRINDLSRLLIDNDRSIQYNLMCDSSRWDIVMSIVNDISEEFRSFVVPKVVYMHSFRQLPYTEEQLQFIHSYETRSNSKLFWKINAIYSDGSVESLKSNQIFASKNNFIRGWKCSAGSQGIYVFADGSVNAGICKSQVLGTISDFEFLDDYITCPKFLCGCPGDMELNKYDPTVMSKPR